MPARLVVSAPPVEGLDLLALVAGLQCSVRPAPMYAYLGLTIELDLQRPEPSSQPDELERPHHRPVPSQYAPRGSLQGGRLRQIRSS